MSARPTAVGRRVLEALANGATLKASRLYPYSQHEYTLKTPATDEKPAKEQKLGLGTVSTLVVYKWLKPIPVPPLWDKIDYEITDAGRAVADEVPA